MDIKPLEDLGLTNAEIKIYLSLLELGSSKVGKIIGLSGLQSSVVHNTLHKLIARGLINFIVKDNIKYYEASNPNNLIDYIEDKKKNFENILPELLLKQKLAKDRNTAVVYEGYKGIYNMLLEKIKDGKKGDSFCFISPDVEENNDEVQNFFRKIDPKRHEKGLVVKGIAPSRLKDNFTDRIKKGYVMMKFSDTLLSPHVGIFKGTVSFYTWKEKPVGYLIYSTQIFNQYNAYFEQLWDSLK